MADDAKDQVKDKETKATEDTEETEGETKSKKKLIIIAAAALTVVLGGGAGAFLFLGSGEDPEQAAKDAKAAESELAEKRPDIFYVSVGPEFTANLASDDGKLHYLQLKVSLLAHEKKVADVLKANTPLIRHRIIELVGSRTYDEMLERQGKSDLRTDVLNSVRALLEERLVDAEVKDVLFTEYVMQ